MRKFTLKTVDVFTTTTFHGNPTGIITNAEGLTVEKMQNIAREINLSESAFIAMPSTQKALARVRYFTPSDELDISGHTTIGACFALIEDGQIQLRDGVNRIYFETNIGEVPLDIYFHADNQSETDYGFNKQPDLNTVRIRNEGWLQKIMTRQSVKDFKKTTISSGKIAEILQIDESEILQTGLPMENIYTGLKQFLIPVKHKETLLNLKPDLIKLSLMNRKHGIQTNDIFSLDTYSDNSMAYSRHFAPAIGLWEDPGSANAAVCIATYLHRHGVTTKDSMLIEQGKDRDYFAKIFVEIDKSAGDLNTAFVGGVAITSITKELQIEDKSGKISFV